MDETSRLLSVFQFSLSRKRAINIVLGGTVTSRQYVSKKQDGKLVGTVLEVEETEARTETVTEIHILTDGTQLVSERKVDVYTPKKRITSEYIRVPAGYDILEITQIEGTPLSLELIDALKRDPKASIAIKEATEIVWGPPSSQTPDEPKIYGIPISSYCLAVLALCAETGIEYDLTTVDPTKGEQLSEEFKRLNPLHKIPVVQHNGLTLFESRAILRYIAGLYNLEAWYPADPKTRGVIDLALDFHANAFTTFITTNFFNPASADKFPRRSTSELETAQKTWDEDIWPATKHILERIPGKFIGGHSPSIADLEFVGTLTGVFTACPDSFVARQSGLADYWESLQGLPRFAEYTADLLAFLRGLKK